MHQPVTAEYKVLSRFRHNLGKLDVVRVSTSHPQNVFSAGCLLFNRLLGSDRLVQIAVFFNGIMGCF